MTTVRVNINNNSVTQYGGYPFVDFCVFNGRPLGAGPSGIFTLDGSGTKDIYTESSDERDIDAWFEIPTTQLGQANIKKGRKLYVSGEFSGSMTATTYTDGVAEVTTNYTVTPRNTDLLHHSIKVPLSSKVTSEFWGLKMANIAGCDFSVDTIDGVFIVVQRGRGL